MKIPGAVLKVEHFEFRAETLTGCLVIQAFPVTKPCMVPLDGKEYFVLCSNEAGSILRVCIKPRVLEADRGRNDADLFLSYASFGYGEYE